ncbi:MAG: hypothetical protein L0Z62_48190 [Gemmataceae bacterium]|nr:hypothetical protein [Gemmataceae bacterium]
MAESNGSPVLNLGFLTVLHESNGYLGGYLVTNPWGRPLEFRLSTAVQPNRVQQILYAGTLVPYICADLIGKTLVEKTAAAVRMVLTDTEAALELRLALEVPVLWVEPDRPEASREGMLRAGRANIRVHPRYPQDLAGVRETLERLGGMIDLAEPFVRIREAIGEARKMGVAARG